MIDIIDIIAIKVSKTDQVEKLFEVLRDIAKAHFLAETKTVKKLGALEVRIKLFRGLPLYFCTNGMTPLKIIELFNEEVKFWK